MQDGEDGAQRQRRVRVERGIYRQPNGRYAVCFMSRGRPRFRAVDGDIDGARRQRALLIAAAQAGIVSASPRLLFATVASWWIARFEAKVAAGERRERMLEAHHYYLHKHLMPALGRRQMRGVTVEDVARLITALRAKGCSEKTAAGALATLHSIVPLCGAQRMDRRGSGGEARKQTNGLAPHVRRQRVLGREEIRRLLAACLPQYRPVVATALYTGMRISELLGLVWADVDFQDGKIHVRAQLSRAHREAPARRVQPKRPVSR